MKIIIAVFTRILRQCEALFTPFLLGLFISDCVFMRRAHNEQPHHVGAEISSKIKLKAFSLKSPDLNGAFCSHRSCLPL